MSVLLWGRPELSDGSRRLWVILGWEELMVVGKCEGAGGTWGGRDSSHSA